MVNSCRSGKEAAQRLRILRILLNIEVLCRLETFLFYKGPVRSTNNHDFSIWELAACTHVLKLHVFFQRAQCSRTAIEASWYVTNKQIREGLEGPFYTYHTRAIRALIQNLPIRVLSCKTRSPTKRRPNSLEALDKSDYK